MPQAIYTPVSALGIGTLIYSGSTDRVHDLHVPARGKNEWGVDTLRRHVGGTPMKMEEFQNALRQGDVFAWAGINWYLQTYDQDESPIFPTVTMLYKGLLNGIPEPHPVNETVILTASVSTSSPEAASRDIEYFGYQTTWRWISTGKPAGPKYEAPDVSGSPIIIRSVITDSTGKRYPGNAPTALVTALTPAETDRAIVRSESIIGTPYWECETVAQRIFA